jgi:hypothetical protein
MQGLSSAAAFAAAIAVTAMVLLVAPWGSGSVWSAVKAVDLIVAAVAGAAVVTLLGIAGGQRHRRRRAR